MTYKEPSFEDEEFINQIKEQRHIASLEDTLVNKYEDEKIKHNKNKENFDITKYCEEHQSWEISTYISLNWGELNELSNILEAELPSHRGNHSPIDIKTQLFLTLCYFSTNMTLDRLSKLTKIPITTIERIQSRIVDEGFPIFTKKFIPQTYIPESTLKFKNYPSAVAAIDSTTIPHNKPLKFEEQKLTYDHKNAINGLKVQALVNPDGQAFHITIEPHASVHDKKIFDNSQVSKLLTQVNGKEVEVKKILADKGYQGITQSLPNAEVMQKGKDNEIEQKNNSIAADRQIVERWNNRFKTYWLVLTQGWRGDRTNLPNIVKGLAAITNYLINLHPLTCQDDVTEEQILKMIEEEKLTIKTSKTSVCKTNLKQYQKLNENRLYIKKPEDTNDYTLVPSIHYIGIANQGQTCHLNCALQLLYSIPPIQNLVKKCAQKDLEPCKSLNNIFQILRGKKAYRAYAAKTEQLTSKFSNENEWLHQRGVNESLIELLDLIEENLKTIKESIMPLIGFESRERRTNQLLHSRQLIFKISDRNIIGCLQNNIKEDTKIVFKDYFFVLISRNGTSDEEIPLELELDCNQLSDCQNDKFILRAVVAIINNYHYITFKFVNDSVYVINDCFCYQCSLEEALCLKGGKKEECDLLWSKMNNLKWVSSYLLYARENARIL